MAIPVSREAVGEKALAKMAENTVGTAMQYQPEVLRHPDRPFQPPNASVSKDSLTLAMIPREDIEAIRPQYPIWDFPPEVVHTPPVTVSDAFTMPTKTEPRGAMRYEEARITGKLRPAPEFARSILSNAGRGQGRPAHRQQADMSGSARNTLGPV
jgi:hypothetical protein